MTSQQPPPPGPSTPATPEQWDNGNWLTYYSQCCGFLLQLGQKFITLLTQASVYTTAVCAAMIALHKDHNCIDFVYLIFGAAACLPLLGYWHFLVAYRKQVEETGNLVREIEEKFTHLGRRLSLLQRLRDEAPIYKLRPTALLARWYPVVLMLIILLVGTILSLNILNLCPSDGGATPTPAPTATPSSPTPSQVTSATATPTPTPQPTSSPVTGPTVAGGDPKPPPSIDDPPSGSCHCNSGSDKCKSCEPKRTLGQRTKRKP